MITPPLLKAAQAVDRLHEQFIAGPGQKFASKYFSAKTLALGDLKPDAWDDEPMQQFDVKSWLEEKGSKLWGGVQKVTSQWGKYVEKHPIEKPMGWFERFLTKGKKAAEIFGTEGIGDAVVAVFDAGIGLVDPDDSQLDKIQEAIDHILDGVERLRQDLSNVGGALVEWGEIVSEMANRNQTMRERCEGLIAQIDETRQTDHPKGKARGIDWMLLA